jgi:hypothetical protein
VSGREGRAPVGARRVEVHTEKRRQRVGGKKKVFENKAVAMGDRKRGVECLWIEELME